MSNAGSTETAAYMIVVLVDAVVAVTVGFVTCFVTICICRCCIDKFTLEIDEFVHVWIRRTVACMWVETFYKSTGRLCFFVVARV